jgi:hypothetical protein
MRFQREFLHDLFVESDPAGFTAHFRQQPIIVAFASPKPAALQVEGYTRNQDEVQPV